MKWKSKTEKIRKLSEARAQIFRLVWCAWRRW